MECMVDQQFICDYIFMQLKIIYKQQQQQQNCKKERKKYSILYIYIYI